MLNIPGFTFPVRQFLFEDVLELLQSVFIMVFIMFIVVVNTLLKLSDIYTVSQKNNNDVAHSNFNAH